MKTYLSSVMRSFLSLTFITILCILGVRALPGQLDPTFNGTGKVKAGFGFNQDFALATAVQPDGKIVALGNPHLLARYNPDGTLDASFGDRGVASPIIIGYWEIYCLALQPDGKILAAGYSQPRTAPDFMVFRLNADGSLDRSFGVNGLAVTTIHYFSDFAYALAVQPDGKIVAAGTTFNSFNSTDDIALARFNANGTLDASFGSQGVLMTDVQSTRDSVSSLVIQTDGRILVGGSSATNSTSMFAMVRYEANGALDGSFDGDGKVLTALGASSGISSIALDPDGKIVAAGRAFDGSNNEFALARYNADGSLDEKFGSGGKVITTIGESGAEARAVVVQTDRKIAVIGSTGDYSDGDFAAARYNPDGSLDDSFDADGVIVTDFYAGYDKAYGAALQADGKIIAVGGATKKSLDFALARYNADGSLDATFGGDGKVTSAIGQTFQAGYAVALQSDNKIVVAGTVSGLSYDEHVAVARFNQDGTPDRTFGEEGLVRTVITESDFARGLAIQTDGKIVVAGYTAGSPERIFVVRYNPDGSLDATFHGDGKVLTNFENCDTRGAAVTIQPDGKIVVAGDSRLIGTGNFALVRYNADGSLDTSFDGDGKLVTAGVWYAKAVLVQPDGKIIAAGGDFGYSVARYNPDGSLDNTFHGQGFVTGSAGVYPAQFKALGLYPDGKIVIAGTASQGQEEQFAALRFNADGWLDATFDGDGVMIHTITERMSRARSLAIQADGKLLIGGETEVLHDDNYSYTKRFAVARYNYDGSVDAQWGTNGVSLVKIDLSDSAYAMTIDRAGRAIVTGNASVFIGVVRLQGDSAVTATIGGKVLTGSNIGIKGATVKITGGSLPSPVYRQTNSFGNYSFENLPVNESYEISVSSKRYFFESSSRQVFLTQNYPNMNFSAAE